MAHSLRSIMLVLIVFLLFSGLVSAIGVSPIRKVLKYEGPGEYSFDFKVINDQDKDIRVVTYARGEFEDKIKVLDPYLILTSEQGETYMNYKLDLPDLSNKPGTHKTDIVMMEYPSEMDESEQPYVSSTSSVVSQVWVKVPYPGKYAEISLYAESKEGGVDFVLNVINFGREDINGVKGNITILGPTRESVGIVYFEEGLIAAGQNTRIQKKWDAEVLPGKYTAKASVVYDGVLITLEEEFRIGELFIEISDVKVGDFNLGDIAVFEILLQSKWNEQIENVYGEMTITDEEGQFVDNIKTASVDMDPLSTSTLNAYWDTKEQKIGRYSMKILVHYSERVTEKKISAEVGIDGIRTDIGPTAEVVASNSAPNFLIILAVLLLLANSVWFIYIFGKKKKGKK